MHACDDRNSKLCADRFADGSTGDTVPTCCKSGSGEEEVRLIRRDELQSLFCALLWTDREMVVAADDRGNDFSPVTQLLL